MNANTLSGPMALVATFVPADAFRGGVGGAGESSGLGCGAGSLITAPASGNKAIIFINMAAG